MPLTLMVLSKIWIRNCAFENLGCGIGFGNSNFWRKWEKEIYTLINPSVVHKTRLLYTHIHKKTQKEQAHAK